MAKVTGNYLIARTLKEHGVEAMFYLTGGPSFDLVNNAQDMGIRTFDFRHEQAAAMAAHAYTRVTGKPGITTASSGPGTLNLLTGQYTAYLDNAPMITLGGAGPYSEWGKGGFQELDQAGIFEGVSKAAFRVTETARYPEQIATAFRIATTGRPGPVYVDCAEDVLYGEVDEADVPPAPRAERLARAAAEPASVKEAVRMIREASRPLVLAGGGAFFGQAWEELRELVERARLPFYTTPISRGLVADDHEMSFPAARSTAFREADLVLVVGTRMNWVMTFGQRIGAGARLIQIDIEASEIGHNRSVELGLVGDCKAVLRQILDEGDDMGARGDARAEWLKFLHEQNEQRMLRSQPLLNSEQAPVHPLRLCNEVNKFLDRDAILTVDGNEILHYARQSINTYMPGHRINPGPTGCMGVGLPYAIGAQIAKPDVQVVSVHGDGSLGMNMMDFDTAVRFNLPIVVVVSNNEGWFARSEDIRRPGRELGVTRFDKIAQDLGGHGEMVESPDEIRPALERAFASGKPAVVNVHTDPTAKAVSRFAGSRME